MFDVRSPDRAERPASRRPRTASTSGSAHGLATNASSGRRGDPRPRLERRQSGSGVVPPAATRNEEAVSRVRGRARVGLGSLRRAAPVALPRSRTPARACRTARSHPATVRCAWGRRRCPRRTAQIARRFPGPEARAPSSRRRGDTAGASRPTPAPRAKPAGIARNRTRAPRRARGTRSDGLRRVRASPVRAARRKARSQRASPRAGRRASLACAATSARV